MKKISYLLLLFLSAIVCGCSEYEQPYVGYIVVERAVLDAAANSSATVTADTDISSAIVVDNVDADWCQVSVNGKEITVTATSANTDSNYRTATVSVRSGYRQTTFTVLQKYNGQEFALKGFTISLDKYTGFTYAVYAPDSTIVHHMQWFAVGNIT